MRAALEAEFEVIVAKVVEADIVVVTGLHPFRGRFVAHFTEAGKVLGDARLVDYDHAWTITPDLRSSSTDVVAAKRKPAGIGVEKLTRTDGMMNVTALRAWLKKEA